MLLREKWIVPLYDRLLSMTGGIIDDLTDKVTSLAAKYETGLVKVEQTIADASESLSLMLDDLNGSKYDMQAYNQLKELLNPENDEE